MYLLVDGFARLLHNVSCKWSCCELALNASALTSRGEPAFVCLSARRRGISRFLASQDRSVFLCMAYYGTSGGPGKTKKTGVCRFIVQSLRIFVEQLRDRRLLLPVATFPIPRFRSSISEPFEFSLFLVCGLRPANVLACLLGRCLVG
jgi:hypothetical protein